jgi:hypothetical protein
MAGLDIPPSENLAIQYLGTLSPRQKNLINKDLRKGDYGGFECGGAKGRGREGVDSVPLLGSLHSWKQAIAVPR